MDQVFEKALTAVVRKHIMQQNQVFIDGLGSFRMEHVKQSTSKGKNGKTVINPPRDVIVFTPEKEAS